MVFGAETSSSPTGGLVVQDIESIVKIQIEFFFAKSFFFRIVIARFFSDVTMLCKR